MSIIPAAGLAKALTVVTISLHPGAHVPASYTVHQGDTLSVIATRVYGSAGGRHHVEQRHQLVRLDHRSVMRRLTAAWGPVRAVLRAGVLLASVTALAAAVLTTSRPAQAAAGRAGLWDRAFGTVREYEALRWALTQKGKPYLWGGIGPNGYDCSGLVYEAFARTRLWLPRTTYGMLGSWHLVRTWRPTAGDLAFYGSGHVEFVIRGHDLTFGAHRPGEPVGVTSWGGSWWRPTAFYRVTPG